MSLLVDEARVVLSGKQVRLLAEQVVSDTDELALKIERVGAGPIEVEAFDPLNGYDPDDRRSFVLEDDEDRARREALTTRRRGRRKKNPRRLGPGGVPAELIADRDQR